VVKGTRLNKSKGCAHGEGLEEYGASEDDDPDE